MSIKKSRVVKTPGWFVIRAFFKEPIDEQRYEQEIKSLPFYDRRWCRKIKAWAVRRNHDKFVVRVAKQYLGLNVKA